METEQETNALNEEFEEGYEDEVEPEEDLSEEPESQMPVQNTICRRFGI